MKRLSDRLETIAADTDRPNNALEARTSLLVLQVSQAMLDGAAQALGALWPQFSEVLKQAEGLGEYPIAGDGHRHDSRGRGEIVEAAGIGSATA